MKALTLWQPYATLVAKGIMRIATRAWQTNYRGNIAIHSASRKLDLKNGKVGSIIKQYNLESFMPIGQVIGYVYLSDVIPVEEFRDSLTEEEKRLGDFRDGLFGFFLSEPKLIKPVYHRQKYDENGLWHWLPPLGKIIDIKYTFDDKLERIKTL